VFSVFVEIYLHVNMRGVTRSPYLIDFFKLPT